MTKLTKKERLYYFLTIFAIIEIVLFAYITYRKLFVYSRGGFFPSLMSLGNIYPYFILNFVIITFFYTLTIPEVFPCKILMPIVASVFTLAGGNILIVAIANAAIWVPYKFVKINDEKEENLKGLSITLASVLIICPIWFSFSEPAVWYRLWPVTKSENELTPEEELALYQQFLDYTENASIDNVYFSSSFNDHDYAVTETLRDQVLSILRKTPAEYYYHQQGQQTPWSEINFRIQLLDMDDAKSGTIGFYYELDDLNPQSLGAEGATIIRVFFGDHREAYLTIDNKYLDEIFALLPDYAIDYAVRNLFCKNITSAKAEDFSVSVVMNGDSAPVTVAQDALDRIGEIFDNLSIDYTHFENPEDFPSGKIEAHIEMRDCDTTLDIVYDYRRYDQKKHEQSERLGINGISLIRICARGETEYFLVGNYGIDEFMHELGLYEPEETE